MKLIVSYINGENYDAVHKPIEYSSKASFLQDLKIAYDKFMEYMGLEFNERMSVERVPDEFKGLYLWDLNFCDKYSPPQVRTLDAWWEEFHK